VLLPKPAFNEAFPGDKLITDSEIELFFVNPKPELIETYCYSPEEAWLSYEKSVFPNGEYIFDKHTFFRVKGEARFFRKNTLRLALIADTHYVIGGNWEKTAGQIWAANRQKPFDAIIHLGDVTDGMLGKDTASVYAGQVLRDLRAIGCPVYVTLGNHDYNYFHSNSELFTAEELSELYLDGRAANYTVDMADLKLICLESFNPALIPHGYGYSEECLSFLEHELEDSDKPVIIFSHLTAKTELQAWNDTVRNSKQLMEILHRFSDKILAFINGHQHTDHIYNDLFPLITINCAKCECFHEYKPAGSDTPERRFYDDSSVAWDILTVDTYKRVLTFERQGAGKNRVIKNGHVQFM
jgi:predicted phosphodiesterase